MRHNLYFSKILNFQVDASRSNSYLLRGLYRGKVIQEHHLVCVSMKTLFMSAREIFDSFHLNANSSDFENFFCSVLQRGFSKDFNIGGAF